MADVKISGLPLSTTPLAGTEVLPIVQGGQTRQVSVNNLTTGKAVSATQYTSTIATGTAPLVVSSTTEVANLKAANATSADTANQVKSNATTGVLQVAGPAAAATRVMTTPDANFTAARTDAAQTFTGLQSFNGSSAGGENIRFADTTIPNVATIQQTGATTFFNSNITLPTNGSFSWRHTNSYTTLMGLAGGTGNLTLNTGNLVIGTSGKGISLPGSITWTSGSGTPEGVVTAPVGSLYSRSDGGLLTSLYVKESGSGNTGWVGK
jgi:hypothetical protein